MSVDASPLILKAIDEAEGAAEIKELLNRLLKLEHQHSGESRWNYSTPYQAYIKELAGKWASREDTGGD